jgi:hypothetical protein
MEIFVRYIQGTIDFLENKLDSCAKFVLLEGIPSNFESLFLGGRHGVL